MLPPPFRVPPAEVDDDQTPAYDPPAGYERRADPYARGPQAYEPAAPGGQYEGGQGGQIESRALPPPPGTYDNPPPPAPTATGARSPIRATASPTMACRNMRRPRGSSSPIRWSCCVDPRRRGGAAARPRRVAARGRPLRRRLPGRPTRRRWVFAYRLALGCAVGPEPQRVAVGRVHDPPRRDLAAERLPPRRIGFTPRRHRRDAARFEKVPGEVGSTASGVTCCSHHSDLWHRAARATEDGRRDPSPRTRRLVRRRTPRCQPRNSTTSSRTPSANQTRCVPDPPVTLLWDAPETGGA